MHPNLADIPVFVVVALAAAWTAVVIAGENARVRTIVLAAVAAAAVAGVAAATQDWGQQYVPLRTYGTMILLGVLCGVWMAARRARLLGVNPIVIVDVGYWGVIVGLIGARILHIAMNWDDFTPFHNGFDVARIGKWFKLWEAGLAFHGVLFTVVPFTWWYCRRRGVPALALVDLAMPSLIAGQAFGRIGCFMFGCCYGKMCDLPWAVHFPHGAPAWQAQVADGVIGEHAAFSAGVHPTQIYALIAGALTAAFLYAWWPRRRYDGQILALSLIMAGVSRFFEQMLRDDEPAALASVPSMTVANWLAIVVVVAGAGLLLYFRRRGKLHTVTERGG